MDVGIISRAKAFLINAQGGLHMHVVHLILCGWEWTSLFEILCEWENSYMYMYVHNVASSSAPCNIWDKSKAGSRRGLVHLRDIM